MSLSEPYVAVTVAVPCVDETMVKDAEPSAPVVTELALGEPKVVFKLTGRPDTPLRDWSLTVTVRLAEVTAGSWQDVVLGDSAMEEMLGMTVTGAVDDVAIGTVLLLDRYSRAEILKVPPVE